MTERLRKPLPVIAAALASFVVVLVLLTARVVTGHDPALGTPSAAVVAHGGHQVLRTTASGRAIAVGTQGTSGAAGAQLAGIVTRTSGAPGSGGLDDE